MSWIVLTLISAFCFSIATIIQRLVMKEKENDPAAFGFVFQFSVATLIFIYSLFVGFTLPSYAPILNFIFMGFAYACANIFLFKALKIAEVSEVSVVNSTSILWTVGSAALFLGERIELLQAAGILSIVSGVIALSIQKKKFIINRGHTYALISAFFFGVAFTNDVFLLKYFNPVSYSVLNFLFPAVMILLLQPKAAASVKNYIQIDKLKRIYILAIFYAVAFLSIFYAYTLGGEASQIIPMSRLSTALTVVIGVVFLKERDRLTQKIAGAALVLAGFFLLR